MSALKKIVEKEYLGQRGELKTAARGRVVTYRWPPAYVQLTLECGHKIVRLDSHVPRCRAHCQECENSQNSQTLEVKSNLG